MGVRRVVMFVYNDVVHDSRVWKEAGTLSDAGLGVAIVGLQPGGLPDREERSEATVVRVSADRGLKPGAPSPFRLGGGAIDRARWLRGYWQGLTGWRDRAVHAALTLVGADRNVVWHGHDLTGLLPAARARRIHGGALVYDSHELYVESGSVARLPSPARSLLARYENRLAARADAVITVNESIANELGRRFGQRVHVVRNCPPLWDEVAIAGPSPMRETFGLGQRPVVMHHGVLVHGRGMLNTVAALSMLDETVALVFLGDGELQSEIARLADDPRYRGRLFHHPAVPRSELPRWVAGADVGVVTFEPISRNYQLVLPNKLFEYMGAGVPMVVSDLPEMGRIVRETGTGTLCDPEDPASIAAAIRQILDASPAERQALRTRCRTAARDRYSWELESRHLIGTYEQIERGI